MMNKLSALLATSFLLGLVSSNSSIADNAELESLLASGETRKALRMAEKINQRDEANLESRFLLARAQVAAGKLAQAEQTYQQLISEAPRQPEPYVNLAKIYVDSDRLQQARTLLVQSIDAHPGYSLVYRNLVDIHSVMASKAYRSALLLESTANRPTLKIAESLSPATSQPVTNSTESNKPDPVDTVAAVVVAEPDQPQPEPVKTAAVEPSTVTISVPRLSDEETRQTIKQSTLDWARAWSDRNVAAYLNFYDDDYVPAGSGMSRKKWEAQRNDRIAGKRFISIKATEIDVQVTGDNAVVELTQAYRSDTFHDTIRKELKYQQRPEGWRIVGEAVLKLGTNEL